MANTFLAFSDADFTDSSMFGGKVSLSVVSIEPGENFTVSEPQTIIVDEIVHFNDNITIIGSDSTCYIVYKVDNMEETPLYLKSVPHINSKISAEKIFLLSYEPGVYGPYLSKAFFTDEYITNIKYIDGIFCIKDSSGKYYFGL